MRRVAGNFGGRKEKEMTEYQQRKIVRLRHLVDRLVESLEHILQIDDIMVSELDYVIQARILLEEAKVETDKESA